MTDATAAACLEVVHPGPLTTVQDLGRPGLAALGVGCSGAADAGSLRLANRLVGNDETAACLEVTFGGLHITFPRAGLVALTGAPCPLLAAGRPAAMNAPLALPRGGDLRLGPPSAGLRTYLAVRGGIAVDPVLGSRSTDLLAGLGPPVVAAGTRLPVGSHVAGPPTVDLAPVPALPSHPVLRLVPGPRNDWFTPAALEVLTSASYVVTPQSNRIALRLAGSPLRRSVTRELPSEATVTGALQVPPDGQPVLFLADHPVTGGYPVVAVVVSADVPLAAQARPGQTLRFRWDAFR